jgi:thiamine biosynthesis lipoprotein
VTAFKRSRPLLGTYFKIELETESSQLVSRAFAEATRLELIFSGYNAESELSRFNSSAVGQWLELSLEFTRLFKVAADIWHHSSGAFNPYLPAIFLANEVSALPIELRISSNGVTSVKKNWPVELDFNGIAKGFIVDQVAELLENEHATGTVNAGGDIRFFGKASLQDRRVSLRLGHSDAPIIREMSINADSLTNSSIASSSASRSKTDDASTTQFSKYFRAGVDASSTVAVVSGSCMVSDALTKVGLYASDEIRKHCADLYRATILTFDSSGQIFDVSGAM